MANFESLVHLDSIFSHCIYRVIGSLDGTCNALSGKLCVSTLHILHMITCHDPCGSIFIRHGQSVYWDYWDLLGVMFLNDIIIHTCQNKCFKVSVFIGVIVFYLVLCF